MGNRAHYIILDAVARSRLGFINVYAPNHPRDRSALWEALLRELPNGCRWLLMGDLNMVERRADKSSACGRMLPAFERHTFELLKTGLNLDEPPLAPDSLRYSWDNLRSNGARVLARLDRAYVFHDRDTVSSATVADYRILGGCTQSDHSPVVLKLQL
ncbi:hypothetical protein M758_4G205500, partial [Ceratodon purpureus]